jgi:hypothetical protein
MNHQPARQLTRVIERMRRRGYEISENSRGGGVGGGSRKPAWRWGTNGMASRTSTGMGETNACRIATITSIIFSVLIRRVSFRCCCSSCCRPARILRQREHGCFPSNVLTMAMPTESHCEKAMIMRVHATDCKTSQCPPSIATIAMQLATHPAMWNNLFKSSFLSRVQRTRFEHSGPLTMFST